MREELRECPFCGSSSVTIVLGVGLMWSAGCNECGCRTQEYLHSVDAVTAWNRRPDQRGRQKDPDEEPRRVSEIMADMMGDMADLTDTKEVPF